MASWKSDERIASLIAKTSIEAVDATEVWFGTTLDGTPASVQRLEKAVGGVAASEHDTMVRLWGAYIGEVLRRDVGGEWGVWLDDAGPAKALRCRGVTVFPHDKVHKRLVMGSTHDLWAYYQTFKATMIGR